MDEQRETERFISLAILCLFVIILIYTITQLRTCDLVDLEDVMTNFHLDPDYDDFAYVYARRRHIPHTIMICWLYGVLQTQPHFISYYGEILTRANIREVQRKIRRAQTNPTADILDCVWAVYFGSGDSKYSDIIGKVAHGEINADPDVAAAARWSYESTLT
jgi:hypothetical protein